MKIKMIQEIEIAVNFLMKLVNKNRNIEKVRLKIFGEHLEKLLILKFQDHWYPARPWKGQGYRCLRINGSTSYEPTIARASELSAILYYDLNLPVELSLWIDPDEVSCRFGEVTGSPCTIALFRDGKVECNFDRFDLPKKQSDEIQSTDKMNEQKCSQERIPSLEENIVAFKENVSPTGDSNLIVNCNANRQVFKPLVGFSQDYNFQSTVSPYCENVYIYSQLDEMQQLYNTMPWTCQSPVPSTYNWNPSFNSPPQYLDNNTCSIIRASPSQYIDSNNVTIMRTSPQPVPVPINTEYNSHSTWIR